MSEPIWIGQPRACAARRKAVISVRITTSPTKVDGARRDTSSGSGSPAFMPIGVALTTRSKPAGSLEPVRTLDLRIVPAQPRGQALGGVGLPVVQGDRADAGSGQRGGNRAADAAGAHHQHAGPGQLQALALHAAHEALAVEQVAFERAVDRAPHCVAGAGHVHRRGDAVEQAHGGHLVRHGDERAADVGEREHRAQEGGVVRRLAAHGHHARVDADVVEVRVVDHRRLEGVRGVADVGDEFGVAVDHGVWAWWRTASSARLRRGPSGRSAGDPGCQGGYGPWTRCGPGWHRGR